MHVNTLQSDALKTESFEENEEQQRQTVFKTASILPPIAQSTHMSVLLVPAL